jgi:hypothetical protein
MVIKMQSHQHVATTASLPIDDGWNDTDPNDRLIQGTLLKCVDGVWTAGGAAAPKQLLALATVTALQLWKLQKPVNTIVKRPGHPWPHIDDLNAEIPEEDWEVGLDGQPRAPWQKQFVVYLLEPNTAENFTFANGTAGANQAVQNLKNAVKGMRLLRGDHVVPLVELQSRPMKTKFGTKQRPHFHVIEWRNLDGGFTLPSGGEPQLALEPTHDSDGVPYSDDLSAV